MPDTAQQQIGFEPVHDAHAIEQAAFLVQFSQPIEISRFNDATKAFKQKFGTGDTAELPGNQALLHVAFQIGSVPSSSAGNTAHQFLRTSAAGIIENELRMELSSIVFRTSTYTRWANISAQVSRYMGMLLPYYNSAQIASVGFTVVDKFVWQGAIDSCNPSLLLRNGSPYVCPHVLKERGLWHSHTGMFIRYNNFTKRLLNLNLDCLEESSSTGELRNVISVTTVVTDTFNQPGYDTSAPLPDGKVMGFVDQKMDELHTYSKQVFADTVNDNTCQRIALVL